MSLTQQQLTQLGELARIEISDSEREPLLRQLESVLDILEKLQAVDTTGVEPMTHPQSFGLRLRVDEVTETDQRSENQQCAPSVEDGLYLVPRVIE